MTEKIAHVFRKYKGYNPNEIKCWSLSKGINTDSFVVDNITTSKGSSKAGTAIPSPLARMELFDTAFNILASDEMNLEGNTIYHQLVSDCLDVFQMMFNTRSEDIGAGKKIWFKEWKVQENIDKLKAKGEKHPNYLLGKSLGQIFFDKDNTAFANTGSIFLIYYENTLLGGTSPLTLFFTSPNWSRQIRDGAIINIPQSSDGDVFFDSDIRPLHLRDEEFVKYLFTLCRQNKEAFEKAAGLRKYINKAIKNNKRFSDLFNNERITVTSSILEEEYSKIMTNVENKLLTINGLYFYRQKEEREREKILNTSDFIINATTDKYRKQFNEKNEEVLVYPPLVLINGMNINGDYIEKNIPWNPITIIRDLYHRSIPLYDRKLPQGNSSTVVYPFITTEDFLEDYLLEVPYNINSTKFFSGFKGDFKYLLPIKKEYFNFFTFADLKNALTITLTNGVVRATLKVPIKNKKTTTEILFVKEYNKTKGTIIDCRVGMGIYPFYKIAGSDASLKALNDYDILLANRIEQDGAERVSLHFFSYDKISTDTNQLERKTTLRSVFDQGGATATSRYYKLRASFDYITMSYKDSNGSKCNGLIVPNFENRTFGLNQTKGYTFAIDFGTSNTHVAYMENTNSLPLPFEIEEADQQMVLLNAPGTDTTTPSSKFSFYGQFPAIDLTLRREFLPAVITDKGKNSISFPFKTATCEVANFGKGDDSNYDLFSHINIGYYIDQEETQGDVIYTTNLKWLLENNNDNANKNRVRFFLKQLLVQIKVKTILNNGDLKKLQVAWSLPLSMTRGNRVILRDILSATFKEVFEGTGANLLESIPESVAPYFYLTKTENALHDMANIINVDIGGGTTDIMMFMESAGQIAHKYISTSFRFAGNDLWGSGFNGKLKDNGFITNYFNYQKANNISPASEIKYLNKAQEDGSLRSDDLISLLFKYDHKFRFSDSITIGNPGMLTVMYLHYCAIIYHIVEIVELKKYPFPRYLSFTGKGSQYIKMICGGGKPELEEFTRLLIRIYAGKEVQKSFEVILNPNPKEVTANGSVLYARAEKIETEKYNGVQEFVHPGFDPLKNPAFAEIVIKDAKTGFLVKDVQQVNSPLNIAVLENLNAFLDKTLNNREVIDFLGEFKIKNLKSTLELLRWDGNIDNGEGLVYDSYRKVLNDLNGKEKDEPLPQSLFFFAFKEALYKLSKHIVSNKTV
ncbi:hypothetical protein SAMN05518672_1146 [Chitinophaga sp. CF118]|uniref:hypothetical protein n=1 Tax=Chitinophaga sp. CF118 TaxID=1884367 RepID=UPI0008E88487|nr:hypothetical protein [Chitinophaga sp. CF118]SFF00422.1 hypothetical protein SAMN05518672_1146 [Chitinophaga sp. CF118]